MLYCKILYLLFTDNFFRPLIDYRDIIYHNSSFCEKFESAQYKVTLALTGALRGTSREIIIQELGLRSWKSRRWLRRLGCMFKIIKNEAPSYLISLIPKREQTFNTRNKYQPTYNCSTDYFKYSFFSLYSKWLVQSRCQIFSLDKELKFSLNFQK